MKKSKEKGIKKDKRKNWNLGIRSKINGIILSVIFLFALLLAFTMSKSMEYNSQYEKVLENISKITYIKTNSTKVARAVVNLCAGEDNNIADSGHLDMIETIEQYIEDIDTNIGKEAEYSQNRNQLSSLASEVNKFVTLYREIIEICGENYSLAASDKAAEMNNLTSFLSTNAENLLTYEITRSEDIQQQIQEKYQQLFSALIILMIVMVVITVTVSMLISGSITKPIQELKKKITVIADGDLSGTDIVAKKKDETGHLTIAFNKMKKTISDILRQVLEGAAGLKEATGTVNERVAENAEGSAKIAGSIGEMQTHLQSQKNEVAKIVEQIKEMESISELIVNNAGKIHANSEDSRKNADIGMNNIVAYVEQLEVIDTSIKEVTEVFSEFEDNTRQMTEMLEAISEIAAQTNLLSLNASIEAARAGDAGKGFAVVADEIRKLADNSQKSANEIGEMIGKIQGESKLMNGKLEESLSHLQKGNEMTLETKNSFGVIKDGTVEVGVSVADILRNLEMLTGKIEEAVKSAAEIQNTADESVTEINEINAVVIQENENLEEVSLIANKLLELTRQLENMVGEFKLS